MKMFTIIIFVCTIIIPAKANRHSLSTNIPSTVSIAEEITIKFIEPFDVANKLLYDLDHLIDSFIQDKTNDSTTQLDIISKNAEPEPGKDSNKKENNIFQLINNLSDLDKKLQTTFQDLQTRRRYVLGAMIRQMQNTVRKIRSNVSRMQVQLSAVANVATQMPLFPRPIIHSINVSSTESTFNSIQANKEIIEQIEERLNEVSKKINDIIIRLNDSLNVPKKVVEPINPIKTLNTIIHKNYNNKMI